MLARGLATMIAVLFVAGCASPAPEETETLAAEGDGGLQDPGITAAPSSAPSPPPADTEVPLVLEGNTGTGIIACVMPVARCVVQEATAGASDILLDGLVGRISAGTVTLSWSPTSPATNELSFGFMTMGSDACEGVDLGGARGASPLSIEIAPMERDVCADESVHLWVGGNLWGGDDAVYHQVDVDQAFHLEGAFLLAGPSLPSD